MKTTNSQIKKILFFVLLIVLYLVVYTFANNGNKTNDYLTEEWEITDNDTTYTVSTLAEAAFHLEKGDTLTLKTTLPQYSYSHPMLKLWFYHCYFDVNVDGQTIYSSGQKEHDKGLMVPNGAFFVSLPDNSQGKELVINLTTIVNSPFTSLSNIAIQEESTLIKNYYVTDSVQIAIACFLMITGILFLITSIFSARKTLFTTKLIFISSVSIISSLWLFVSAGLLRTLIGSFTYMAELEYLLLYITPVLIIAYIMDRQKKPLFRKICKILIGVFACFILGTVLLDTVHVTTYAAVLVPFHVLAFITLGLLLWFTIYNYLVDKSYSERIFLFGMGTMITLLIVDIIKFNITKYLTSATTDTTDIIIPVSILILVFSMIISSVESILKTYQSNIENAVKDKLSHIDGLTGLYNRLKCTEYLDATTDSATVISFDIKHLKEVNEIYGHSHGDIYLKSFADCLKNVYAKAELIGRIGDDEFVVVEKNVTKEQVEKDIAYLRDLTKVAVTDDQCPLNFSYSSVYSEDRILWKAYEEAYAKIS